MTGLFSGSCPVCGGQEFVTHSVLWPELINAWQLAKNEVAYINRQQGFCCTSCGNNLRSMALASAILHTYEFSDALAQFVCSDIAQTLKVLEINEAGKLSPILNKLSNHRIVHYPEYDMTDLSFESDSFDLAIHSDTLEHVPNPVRALSECHRILRRNGKCIFTVPIIVDRLTRSRVGLAPSHHGQSGVSPDDQLVCTEFGTDIWQFILKAGFRSCEIFSLEYPAAIAMIARK
jgi:SAM-dependent methyltransferase